MNEKITDDDEGRPCAAAVSLPRINACMPEMYKHNISTPYGCILSWAVCATRGYTGKIDTHTCSMMSARYSMGWVGDDERLSFNYGWMVGWISLG